MSQAKKPSKTKPDIKEEKVITLLCLGVPVIEVSRQTAVPKTRVKEIYAIHKTAINLAVQAHAEERQSRINYLFDQNMDTIADNYDRANRYRSDLMDQYDELFEEYRVGKIPLGVYMEAMRDMERVTKVIIDQVTNLQTKGKG